MSQAQPVNFERIPKILDVMHVVWELYPERTLASLFLEACARANADSTDLASVSDAALLSGLRKLEREFWSEYGNSAS